MPEKFKSVKIYVGRVLVQWQKWLIKEQELPRTTAAPLHICLMAFVSGQKPLNKSISIKD